MNTDSTPAYVLQSMVEQAIACSFSVSYHYQRVFQNQVEIEKVEKERAGESEIRNELEKDKEGQIKI